MNRLDWRVRRERTENWTIEGRGRRRRGTGGRPREREERERKTNVWSAATISLLDRNIEAAQTGETPEGVVVAGGFEEGCPNSRCGQREDECRGDTLLRISPAEHDQRRTHRIDEIFLDVHGAER